MRNRGVFVSLRFLSVALIFLATLLSVYQLIVYSRIRSSFPPGMVIADVPVGGLDPQRASERLQKVYLAVPVEVRYRDAVIQIRPQVVGFELIMQAMMTDADQKRMKQPFWPGFWDFLWNRFPEAEKVPLRSKYSEDRLRDYLENELAVRYDQQPQAALPLAGTSFFQPGKVGTVLDVDRAVALIDKALKSPSERVVNLSFEKISPPRPPFQNLEILLQQKIELSDFDGIVEVYVQDLQTGREVHFAYENKERVPADIAFTAASTMKIPIMVSVFRREGEPAGEEVTQLLGQMIERSENIPADGLMETVMDPNLGPLKVTEDLQALGFQNMFLAGYFYPGAPLLSKISTPANSRVDLSAGPDPYNQTTPTEMGMLLEDLYRCAESGGGTFAAVFPGQITQAECQQMINYLVGDKLAALLQAGLPEGTRFAHKHGWIIENDGLMHTIGDAGLVYSPGGNYVISLYMYHPVQLLYPQANRLIAEISMAVYNYFNLPGEQ